MRVVVEKLCKNCEHFDDGKCRRYPPQCPTAVPQRNPLSGETSLGVISAWPQTSPDSWCGEFLPGHKKIGLV